jgi:hypothetical protein
MINSLAYYVQKYLRLCEYYLEEERDLLRQLHCLVQVSTEGS